MKLKQATKLGIIGVILLIISTFLWTLSSLDVLNTVNSNDELFWYYKYLNVIFCLGFILLLPFFITLFKSQK